METDGRDLKPLDEPGSDELLGADAAYTLAELNDGIKLIEPEDPDREGKGP